MLEIENRLVMPPRPSSVSIRITWWFRGWLEDTWIVLEVLDDIIGPRRIVKR